MADVDYSRVSGCYQVLERLTFGSRLQLARVAFLEDLSKSLAGVEHSKILLVGDGDGRFLEALLKAVPNARVDYIDYSVGMLELARKRVSNDARVNWICRDLGDWDADEYAAVSAHFLLDGYEGEERAQMVSSLTGRLRNGGFLLVSDFDSAVSCGASLLVKAMQVFFAIFAKLPFVKVAREDALLESLGGVKLGEKMWLKGCIYSQLWKM